MSLISSSNNSLDGFPLDSLFEECTRFFDLDVDNDLISNEAGVNFVTAKVFPSCEVRAFVIFLPFVYKCREYETIKVFDWMVTLIRFKRMASSSLGTLPARWDTL